MSLPRLIVCLFLGWVCILGLSSQQVRFTDESGNFCRYPGSSESDPFPLQYNAIASNPNKGITLEDWEKHGLPLTRFIMLDQPVDDPTGKTGYKWQGDWILTAEELDEDQFMGSTKVLSLTPKTPSNKKPGRRSSTKPKIDEPVEVVVSNRSSAPNVDVDSYLCKTYLTLLQNILIVEKVSLTKYVELNNEEEEYKNSLFLPLGGLLLLVIAGVVTGIVLMLQSPGSSNKIQA